MKVAVEVPASSANLGVGFDALAMALELTLRVDVEALPGDLSELQVVGEGTGRLGLNDANRFVAGLRRGLQELGAADEQSAWRIEMFNDIPVGRGLGSSAAAVIGGLLCAEGLAQRELGRERLLALAVEIDGHPDNVAAALLGGFVIVTAGAESGTWQVLRLDTPAELRAVVFIPERELPTSRMRAALPDSVPRSDAVHNVGRAALLVAAIARGELELLSAMCQDRLHEPYRAAIYPEFPALERAALEAGALGAALSGAGSTVIALCRAAEAGLVAAAMESAAGRLGLRGLARDLAPRGAGGRLV
ncbi:MAG TPA: homoserine kinase [Candidatus Limnocylindria bacterium]|nr:homoserine kinase [Candidatus Limnocylindria bacterium]